MKRIQGWEIETDYRCPKPAQFILESSKPHHQKHLHRGTHSQNSPYPPICPPLINTDPEQRLRHARGQSLNDWIDMCDGLVNTFPDGVAYPETDADVRALIEFAQSGNVNLIPYGGGSSVVGHLTPPGEGPPTLSVDMQRMNQLIHLSEENFEATFGAGVNGPQLEAQLKGHGFVLGHFPQSWEYSSLRLDCHPLGWAAILSLRSHRPVRQRHLETPASPMDLRTSLKALPVPICGTWFWALKRLGIITQATMRIRRLPEEEHFYAAFFPNFEIGVEAVRKIAQSELAVSMVRLSDPMETETTFQLSGEEKLVNIAKKGLSLFGHGEERCMLIYGLTGTRANRLATINWRTLSARTRAC